MKKALIVVIALFLQLAIYAQQMASGPMIGYIQMREAAVWIQTSEPCNAELYYFPQSDPTKIATVAQSSNAASANTIHFVLTNLEPATTYSYSIKVGNERYPKPNEYFTLTTQVLWQYRTDPPNFRIALGSCTYINEPQYDRPGEPYGGQYEIFRSISEQKPQAMLWLGDNIYLREVDYTNRSGILHRYTHMRSTPELQPLLSSCANYAIWDDHDFGPNDANGNFPLKDLTLEAFKMFWANPSYGLPGCDGEGVTSQFQWGDIDFFMLDNRYHRVAAGIVGQQATILGENQINWLIQSLADSKAPFKMVVVGGQFLNPLDKFEVFNTVPEERQKILDAIEKNNIKGVIFLTGDRHSAELSELTLNNGEKVYDLTVSPLTSRPYDTSKEPNTLRVAGTQAAVRNFGTLDFSGKRGSRNLHITVRDSNGKMLWEKDIAEKVKP